MTFTIDNTSGFYTESELMELNKALNILMENEPRMSAPLELEDGTFIEGETDEQLLKFYSDQLNNIWTASFGNSAEQLVERVRGKRAS